MEPEGTISVNFKVLGNPNKETLDLPLDSNLETLKVLVSDFCTIPIEDIRIIFKGHAFKENDTLQSLGVVDGDTLIVVPNRKPKEQPQNSPEQAAPQQPAAQPTPAPAAEVPNPQQNPTDQSRSQRHQIRIPHRAIGIPIRIPMPRHRHDHSSGSDDDEDQRVESQQIKDLRKQIILTQQKLMSLNSELVKLQTTITEGNAQNIQTKITEIKAKITETMPQVNELAGNMQFDPEGEIFIEEHNDEAPDPEDAPAPVAPQTEEVPDPDDEPVPVPAPAQTEQPAQNENAQPQPAPEAESQPAQNPTEQPAAASVPPQEAPIEHPTNNNNQPRPNMANAFGNLFGSLFGGRQQPQPQQQDADIFTQEEKDMMAADLAIISQEGYIKKFDESYTSTDIYHDI